jgi:hypothetical protein
MSVAIEPNRPTRAPRQRRTRADVEPAVFSVRTFCDANEVSRSFLYKLWDQGRGPVFYFQGKQKRITKEAAAKWRKQMQRATTDALTALTKEK